MPGESIFQKFEKMIMASTANNARIEYGLVTKRFTTEKLEF